MISRCVFVPISILLVRLLAREGWNFSLQAESAGENGLVKFYFLRQIFKVS